MKLFPIGNPFFAPVPTLMERRGDIICSKAGGNCGPNHLSHRILEKKMCHRLLAKIT
jgi:hypothetical protein